VEQKQIVTQHNVIDLSLLDDDVDPEDDGKPAASPVPTSTIVTVAPPFVPVVKVEPGVVPVTVPVHLPPALVTVPRHPAATVLPPVPASVVLLASVVSPVPTLPPPTAPVHPTNSTHLDAISPVLGGAPRAGNCFHPPPTAATLPPSSAHHTTLVLATASSPLKAPPVATLHPSRSPTLLDAAPTAPTLPDTAPTASTNLGAGQCIIDL